LEGCWILTNICYGDEKDILPIFDEKYGVLEFIDKVLQGSDV
jgi:hypothetical protein